MKSIVSTGSYMKNINKLLFVMIALCLVSASLAQFRSQVPGKRQKPPVGISLEESERLFINHGFSLSMASMGGQSFSYGIYSNRLNYLISEKWSLHTNLDLVQPTHSSTPLGLNTFNGQVYYGANLQYRPTKSLQLNISVDNYPRIYRYWPVNRYSPYFLPYSE